MKKSFWQSRMTLVVLGVAVGLLARAILGPPPPEVPPKPSFSTPLPKEVPMTLPVPKVVPEAEEIPDGLKGAPNDVLSANF